MKDKPGLFPSIVIVVLLMVPIASPAQTPLVPMEAEPAPDFSLVNLNGTPVELSSLEGKVVLINFWATWCAPCREELPSMQTLWSRLVGTEFEMLAINVGEDQETIARFKEEFETPLEMPILLDPEMAVVNDYPAIGLPTSYLIDKAGMFRYQVVGGIDWLNPGVAEIISELTGS